jgi:hypothetical protein
MQPQQPFTVNVVSPQFPCGAAWLANALIEVGVLPTDLWGFDTAAEWEHGSDGNSRYVAADMPWRQTLASLVPGRSFRRDSSVDVRFSHLFPWQLPASTRVVLVVRDPRDALHSEWQRHRRNVDPACDADLPAFLSQPFHGGPISFADLLWLHLRCWLQVREESPADVHLIRFEGWKADGLPALRSVARWIGIERSDAELAQACAASDVRHLQRIEAQLAAAQEPSRQFNRRGMPQEWLEQWTPEWHRALGPHWQPLLDQLGYRRSPLVGRERPRFDSRQVLQWRDPIGAADLQAWTGLVDRWKAA